MPPSLHRQVVDPLTHLAWPRISALPPGSRSPLPPLLHTGPHCAQAPHRVLDPNFAIARLRPPPRQTTPAGCNGSDSTSPLAQRVLPTVLSHPPGPVVPDTDPELPSPPVDVDTAPGPCPHTGCLAL